MNPQVPDLDEFVGWGKAADTQRDEDPAAGVRALGRVLSELFTDLTVDLIPDDPSTYTNS